MTNHVHHLVVPLEHDSLRWTFQLTHKCYAEYINARARWSGHLWQERFYSSPVDEDYFWVTIRYIEQNPVKAKMAEHPADYRWSSAAARCSDVKDPIITDDLFWTEKLAQIEDWSSWLSQRDTNETIALLRNRTSRDLPTGSEEFLDSLEQRYGVQARPLKPGRPKREKS
jgi:putative transposase